MNFLPKYIVKNCNSMDSNTKPDWSLEVWSSRKVRVSDLIRKGVLEMMWLQLMCCALSDLLLSQFTRGSDIKFRR